MLRNDSFLRAVHKIRQDTEAIQSIPEHEHYENECKPIVSDRAEDYDLGNEDRNYFDKMHNAAPWIDQVKEEDRLNLEALQGNYGEMDSFVNTFWRDSENADSVIYMGLKENLKRRSERDYAEIGRLFCESLEGPTEEYLSMARKS